jgi:phosphoribosyl 1,2-cyclic phosphate phosphodiesterase
VETDGTSILVDTSTDFRTQALREGIRSIDAVLYTHPHADHIHGLDDIRPLSRHEPIPLFGSQETLDEIAARFAYIFRATQRGGGKPRVDLRAIGPAPFTAAGVSVTPIPILHGTLPIFGYRIGDFAYLTDCSRIPAESYQLLAGLEVLVIGALRRRPHETHFSLDEALEEIQRIRPARAYLTHICHDLEHSELLGELPSHVRPLYDGLRISI